MGDLESEILKKYGTPAIIFAIIVAAGVWFLAHNAASPGGDVTVLWGLVKYTKKAKIHDPVKDLPINKESINPPVSTIEEEKKGTSLPHSMSMIENEKKEDSLPPLSLAIRHNISNDNITSILSELREELKLRGLSVSESGKNISEIPKGTYFFTLGAWLESNTKYDGENKIDDFLSPFMRKEIKRIRPSESYVEIQYSNSGDYNLILFIDEHTASQISQLDGKSEHKFMAAVYPWGQMSSMVSLPVERIIKSKDREVQVTQIETVTVLDLIIR